MEVDNEAIDDVDLGFTSKKPGASQKPPAEKLSTKGIYLFKNYSRYVQYVPTFMICHFSGFESDEAQAIIRGQIC